jgi:hypothetical protein
VAASVQTTQGCSNLLHLQADSGLMIVEKEHQEQQSVWERKELVLKIGSQNEKRVLVVPLIQARTHKLIVCGLRNYGADFCILGFIK